MINNLRKRFITISAACVLVVFSVVFAGIAVINRIQLNDTMDTLTDAIAQNGGEFPEFDRMAPSPVGDRRFMDMEIITEETRYSTRFFTVWLNDKNVIVRVNTDSIFSVTEAQTQGYTEKALKSDRERGWVYDYRYKTFTHPGGKGIVFVNGEMHRAVSNRFIVAAFMTLTGSGAVLVVMLILLSKKAVAPIAESYEKQRQFVTDASHELKTPLTMIAGNVDIVEEEVGHSEWIDDIKHECKRMSKLINQMVELSRMDEENICMQVTRFNLYEAVSETVMQFKNVAEESDKLILGYLESGVYYEGDEAMIRQMISIVMDNAVKYCEEKGFIRVSLQNAKYPTIKVENTFYDTDTVETDRLFDRFYRADSARTYNGSFGIGLSIASEIAKKHNSTISAYKGDHIIGFEIELK